MIKALNKIAIIDESRTYTYTEFLQYVTIFSQQLDVEPGAVVMIYSEMRIGYAFALYAIWHRKCKYTTFYHNLNEDDLLWAVNDIKPAVILTSVAQLSKVTDVVMKSQTPIQILVLDDLELANVPPDTPTAEIEYIGHNIAGIIYTVGISQMPRPAMLTFDNYLNNAHALLKNKFITNKDIVITMLPFYNNWVLLSTLVFPLYYGATCVLCHSRDATTIANTLKKNKVTVFVCVNSVYLSLMEWSLNTVNSKWYYKMFYKMSEQLQVKWISKFLFKRIHKALGNSLRYFITVGNQISEEIWEHFLALGFDMYEGYGMQESTNLITVPVSKRVNPLSVGKFIDCIKYKIIDKEIVLKGACISQGYYERPYLNRTVFNGGWFFTGDAGKVDDNGYVYLQGRTNDTIVLHSGRIVSPAEVENEILSRNKYIKEVGVFYDNNLLKAIIVPTSEMIDTFGTDNNFEKIFHYVKWQVIENYNYIVPFHKRIKKIIIQGEDLKRSTSGKLKRYLLQDNKEDINEKFWNSVMLYNINE